MKKINFRSIYLAGFLLILILPLLNVPPLFSPPDWGKTILFRIILSILGFASIYQILFRKPEDGQEIRISKEAKTAIFLLLSLLGIFFLATIFSLEPSFSFWGNPYRAGGFLNFAFYAFFALLTFLIIRKKEWQKVWDFSIIIGILVCTVAMFQQFGIFKNIFVYSSTRPPSTIGITTALAIYLLLLSFLTLAFAIKTSFKKWFGIKKVFYILSLILFLTTSIFITQTRSAYLGLAMGFLYFFFFYPLKTNLKKLKIRIFAIKGLALILLISVAFIVYYANTRTSKELPQFVQENKFLSRSLSRLSIETALKDPRISGWPIAFKASLSRPVLGYGPENFSVGFDKFYDPTLPLFLRTSSGNWWDRAHNILLDTATQAGVFALLAYLSLLFYLLFSLQKAKKRYLSSDDGKSPYPLVCHAIQATFIGYFTANLFSFDVFSTYLIFFLLVAYSLHLISKENQAFNLKTGKILNSISKSRNLIIPLLFIFLIWFLWNYNLKPFYINTQINIAMHEIEGEDKDIGKAIEIMESLIPQHSILDNYLRLKYVSVLGEGIHQKPESALKLAPRAYYLLKENTKIREHYTRTWLLLGTYTNHLILQNRDQDPEYAEELKKEANQYFQKAIELSPKRQDILIEWIKTDFYSERYEEAKEKSQRCIDLNPELKDCYWQMALTNIYLGNQEEAEEYLKLAKEKRYPVNTETSLLELVNAYVPSKNYRKLVEAYKSLVKRSPDKFQYHISLAVCYRELGDFENARKEALKVFELSPESKEAVEKFLQELE